MKKTGLVIGLVILIVIIGIAIGFNKKSNSTKPMVKKTQISERTKLRNQALSYISRAHYEAKKGNYEAATAACDKAMKVAPNEPVVRDCKRRVEAIQRRK